MRRWFGCVCVRAWLLPPTRKTRCISLRVFVGRHSSPRAPAYLERGGRRSCGFRNVLLSCPRVYLFRHGVSRSARSAGGRSTAILVACKKSGSERAGPGLINVPGRFERVTSPPDICGLWVRSHPEEEFFFPLSSCCCIAYLSPPPI